MSSPPTTPPRSTAASASSIRHFIKQHTSGLDEFEAKVRETSWEEIEAASGLTRQVIESAAQVYVEAERVIGIYGMGLTQHVHGFRT